jgi:hypothetical protein
MKKAFIGFAALFSAFVAVTMLSDPVRPAAGQIKANFADPPASVPAPAAAKANFSDAPAAALAPAVQPVPKGPRIKKIFVPFTGQVHTFTHRDDMKSKTGGLKKAHIPQASIPATTLPVDSTNGQKVSCPMDWNDSLGDCGEAMGAHLMNILSYGQGKTGFTEIVFDQAALKSQYLSESGGDNGMDEDMIVGPTGIFTVGVAGNKTAVAVDHIDFDCTNGPLTQYLIDQFYGFQLAWSVPDAFIQNFKTGATFDVPATPDPNNGHFTCQADVAANGNYTLWTWGSYCFVTPAFIAAVQPSAFVSFSPVQFNPKTGLDSKGRHITTQAAAWVAIGGNPIPASVINAFPPIAPTPVNPPPVNPPVNPPAPAAGAWTVTDPTGQTWTLPINYQVVAAGPNPNSGAFTLDAVEKTMSHALITSLTANNPALEAQRLQVLKIVSEKRAEAKPTFSFMTVLESLFKIVSDAVSGNFAALPADFQALITAFSTAPGKK